MTCIPQLLPVTSVSTQSHATVVDVMRCMPVLVALSSLGYQISLAPTAGIANTTVLPKQIIKQR